MATNTTADAFKVQKTLLGKDIYFDGDYSVSSDGDYSLIESIPALRQSILARLMTNPGEFKFRPTYGAGLRSFVKKKATQTNINLIKRAVETQLSRERRIDEVLGVNVTLGTEYITVSVSVRVAGKALTLDPFTINQFGEV